MPTTTTQKSQQLFFSFQKLVLISVGEAVTDEAAVHLHVADLARLLGRHAEMAERKVPVLKRITL
ncbi:hypothetical protein DPMN_014583 [Dreissena polymorpha]|uniref:Uncharacterized protein n=1 Tax=Dreissena polymorpha TaxID=45954 RepID=A0A9D4NB21_DREPO|nr:hypothetical protein DPMN_014583 [Dreissena polymorpha]